MRAALLWALNAVVSCAVASEPATVTVADLRPAWLQAVPVELKDPTTAVAELCRDKPGEPGWLSQVRAEHLQNDVFIGSLVRRLLRQRAF